MLILKQHMNYEVYHTPLCEVIALRPEGIIAQSNIEDLKDGGKLW